MTPFTERTAVLCTETEVNMVITAFHGFCVALADSVPGVSGGAILLALELLRRCMQQLPTTA